MHKYHTSYTSNTSFAQCDDIFLAVGCRVASSRMFKDNYLDAAILTLQVNACFQFQVSVGQEFKLELFPMQDMINTYSSYCRERTLAADTHLCLV